eukprot:9363877-Pyramimonas_sp.AAC.1
MTALRARRNARVAPEAFNDKAMLIIPLTSSFINLSIPLEAIAEMRCSLQKPCATPTSGRLVARHRSPRSTALSESLITCRSRRMNL